MHHKNQNFMGANKKPSQATPATKPVDIIHPKAAAIDIGAAKHYVAVPPHLCKEHVRSFETHTKGLVEMADWLSGLGITTVAMESTGVYWLPAYDMLEAKGLEVVLAHARYVKNVPGRKTDVSDCQWLQQLHSFGLLHGCHVPGDQVRTLRAYLRQRQVSVEGKVQATTRMEKALQQMNIKLLQAISKLDTQVGMNIVRDIVGGERDGRVLAERHRDYRMKASVERLAEALRGNFREEYLFSLSQALQCFDFHHAQMVACDARIEEVLKEWEGDENGGGDPKQTAVIKKKTRQNEYTFDVKSYLEAMLGVDATQVEGLSEKTVLDIVGEVGTDLGKWKSAKHFASWLGLSPSPQISGGRILKQFRKKMVNRATAAFRMAAYSLHSSKCELGKVYRKLALRKGSATAVKTVARKLAVIFYTMVTTKQEYDPGKYRQALAAQQEKQLLLLQKQAAKLGMKLEKV